jgi:putative nucleotidyltransferase with HDIG domain
MAIRDSATGESVIEHAVGVASANLGQRLAPGKGVVGFVIESGEPYLSNDMTADSLVVPVQGMDPPRAMAAIPMITEEQTIGALVVGRDTPFFEADLRVLAAVGNIAANAIQRATLYEETHRRLMRLNALHNIDKAMTANIDLNATLNVILEQIASQLGIDAASVLIYEAPMHELVYAVGRGFHVKLPSQKALRVGKGLAGRVAIERRMIHIPDLLANGRSFDQMPAAFHDEGFVAYLGMPLIAKGDLKGVLEIFHRKPLDPDREWISFLDTLARQAAIAIDNASLFDGLQRTNLELTLSYDTTLEGWAKALEMRDHPTEGHSRRVTERTLHLARAMGMSTEELVHVRRGAMLHDIGKMSTPDHILHKAGPLTEEEWEIMRVHPITAFNLLSTIPFLRQAIDIPYCHHEKWDGTGYPRGLRGEQIPLAARIFAVVDVWDALHSNRAYRLAWEDARVRNYIHEQAGKHFDPQVVDAFFETLLENIPELGTDDSHPAQPTNPPAG